jgi:hypothetical protein
MFLRLSRGRGTRKPQTECSEPVLHVLLYLLKPQPNGHALAVGNEAASYKVLRAWPSSIPPRGAFCGTLGSASPSVHSGGRASGATAAPSGFGGASGRRSRSFWPRGVGKPTVGGTVGTTGGGVSRGAWDRPCPGCAGSCAEGTSSGGGGPGPSRIERGFLVPRPREPGEELPRPIGERTGPLPPIGVARPMGVVERPASSCSMLSCFSEI